MNGLLQRIATALRGHPCQRVTKQRGNEIHINGASVGISDFKIDIGKFSNKIKEFYKVTSTTVSMDNTQYLLCTSIFQMNLNEKLKDACNRIRLQLIIGYNQLENLLAGFDQNPTNESKEKLMEWQDNMGQISERAIEFLAPKPVKPPRSSWTKFYQRGIRVSAPVPTPEQEETLGNLLSKTMRYQGLEESEMQDALKML